ATIYTFGDLTDTTDLPNRMVINPVSPTWTFAFWQPVTNDIIVMSPGMPMPRSSISPTVVSVYAHRSVYVFRIPQNASEEVKVMETRTGNQTAYSFILMGLQYCVWWHWPAIPSMVKLVNFTRSLAITRTPTVSDDLTIAKWGLD
ncbi:hypothetical protein FRB99_000690, partial [Tulasnella sp. 403]